MNNPFGETKTQIERERVTIHTISFSWEGKGFSVCVVQWVKNMPYASYYPLIVALDTKDHYYVCVMWEMELRFHEHGLIPKGG